MDFKELTRDLMEDFFAIFTCSILGFMIFMYIFEVERVPLTDIFVIFILSIITSLAGLIIYSGKELKRRDLLIRYILHYFVALGVCLFVATYMGWILWSIPISVIRFTMLITGISVSVHLVLFFQTKILSDKLNDRLKERYKNEN